MKLMRMLSWLIGVMFACHFSVALAGAQAASGSQSRVRSNSIQMNASFDTLSGGSSGSRTVTLTFPSGTRTEALKAILNGKDVSSKFSETPCAGSVCATATLSSVDGLRNGKNVLYAVVKKSDGSLASSRLRFDGDELNTSSRAAAATPSSSAQTPQAYPLLGIFLPPAVAINVAPGGFGNVNATAPWIKVGTQLNYPSSSCGSLYQVEVLDRQTLNEVDQAPHCFNDGLTMAGYLRTLTSAELVIVGTAYAGAADATLDTSSIGGKVYNCTSAKPPANCGKILSSNDAPVSYLAIGSGGAPTPGSAYENYGVNTSTPYESFGAFATGTLVEDVNGNYNFQSSNPIEYVVSPNDPANNNLSSVTIQGVGSLSRYKGFNYPNKTVITSPAGETNGYWLLKLQRDNLDYVVNAGDFGSSCIAAGDVGKQLTVVPDCGGFYPTGSSDASTALNAYANLGKALSAIRQDELVFLVTVGTAAYSANQSPLDIARGIVFAESSFLARTLEPLGGTPGQTLSLYTPGSTYTLITCQVCGNSLNGNAVLSTSLAAQQGQTGFVHGLLSRDLNGLYWPTKTSQESQAQQAAGTGADFTMSLVASQQPIEWPELNGTLLPGASSVAGQFAAFNYLSYELVTQYYIRGAQGSHLDDIHYYFAGSNNTYIDYHTFDPINLPFPGAAGTCFTWNDPVAGRPLTCFTQQDLAAVAQQVSAEIVDMDNVLQFMVNGSTNMKDIVATGNGSAALALIGAAAVVQGSTLQPPPPTPVTVNVSGILSLVSSVVNEGVTLATDGLVTGDTADLVTKVGSLIAGVFDGASAISGGFTNNDGSQPLPSPGYTFNTTIGNLANSGLQQQLTAGFDTELDTLLADWGKLSAIGPLITNSDNPAFYSPNQAAQNLAVTLLGQASQRSFFMSILPAYYGVQYYPSWIAGGPSMGNFNDNNDRNCWYASGVNLSHVLVSYPTYGDVPDPWYYLLGASGGTNPNPTDYYILGGSANNMSKGNQNIPFIDSQLASTLFSPGGLNLPIDPFVTPSGPMKSVFMDTRTNGFDGFPADQTAPCNYTNSGVGAAPPSGGPKSQYLTTTTVVVPANSVLGDSVPLLATVTSQTGVPSGIVSFQDGDAELGRATLDATGKASFSASGFALGEHSITADYLVNDPYYTSQSASSIVTVYANAPGMLLSLSTANLSVTYGAMSSPVTMQVNSESGLAGAVNFGCTGLPVGMTCNFNPAQATITAGSSATTSLTISSKATQAAETLWGRGIGILLLPFSLLCLWRIRNGRRYLQGFACLLLLSVLSLGLVIGCGGGSSKAQQLQETGSKTILVTATSGSTTRTIPLVLNIQ
jgi:hypothetical protein